MIKKIEIENYGPFDKVVLDLTKEKKEKPFVLLLGLNDVGKTILLTAINSFIYGLVKEYCRDNDKNAEIKFTFNIREEYYSKELKDRFDKKFGIKPFTGDLIISCNEAGFTTQFKRNTWESTFEIQNFLKKIFQQIVPLRKNSKKIFLVENFNERNLNEEIDSINNLPNKTKYKTRESQLVVLRDFLKSLNNLFTQKREFLTWLPLHDEKGNFSYIQEEYRYENYLSSEANQKESDIVKLEKIITAFGGKNTWNRFFRLISSDDYSSKKLIDNFREIREKVEEGCNKIFQNRNFWKIDQRFVFELDTFSKCIIWKVKEPEKKSIKLDNKSHGFKWILKLSYLFQGAPENSIIVIDEPERYLHPTCQIEFMKKLLQLAEEKKLKIFIATHSPYVLSGTDILLNSELFVVKKKNGVAFIQNKMDVIKQSSLFEDELFLIDEALNLPFSHTLRVQQERDSIYLFVEGEADIRTFQIAENLYKKKHPKQLENIPKIRPFPLYGKNKALKKIAFALVYQLNYFVFLDETRKEFEKIEKIDLTITDSENRLKFIGDELNGVKEPEDLLTKEVKNNIESKHSLKSSQKPRWFWNILYQEQELLDEKSKENLIKYYKCIKNFVEKERMQTRGEKLNKIINSQIMIKDKLLE